MNYRAAVVTPWIAADGSIYGNRPQLAADYALLTWEDITGQPAENLQPPPSEYTILIECTAAVLAAIEADPTYEILWSEEIP